MTLGVVPFPGYDPVPANLAFLYRVRARNSGLVSAYTVPDLATSVMFTDGSLPGKTVKAAHIGQLRTAVNAVRGDGRRCAGHGAPVGGGDPARVALGLTTPGHTHGALPVVPVKGVHLQELRNRVRLATSARARPFHREPGFLSACPLASRSRVAATFSTCQMMQPDEMLDPRCPSDTVAVLKMEVVDMRTRRWFSALVIVVAFLSISGPALAQERPATRPPGAEAQAPETSAPDTVRVEPLFDLPGPELGATTEASVNEGPIQATAVTSAADVSAGTFGANTGGGTYAFPASVGFGTSSPTGRIHVLNGGFSQESVGNFASAYASNFYKARGTVAAKTVVQANDVFGYLRFVGWDGASFRVGSEITSSVDGTPGASDMPGRLTFLTVPDGGTVLQERMRITNSGNIGIGTTSPAYKLHVVGNAHVAGTLTGTNIAAQYQDIAEWVPSTIALDPGTVVVLNPDKTNEIMPSSSAYDTRVAGVVSEQPGLTLGVPGDNKEMIATTGRVKVRVDASDSPVRVGDLLVTSDRVGYAMKSVPMDFNGRQIHQPGTIVGKALENLDSGEGTILVLLSLQ